METTRSGSRVPVAAVVTLFGSAGLFIASCARIHWRFVRSLLALIFAVGLAARLIVLHIQIVDGAIRKRWMNLFNIDNSSVFFPMHGVMEFVGGTVLPGGAYSALILWLVLSAILKWVSASTGSVLPAEEENRPNVNN